MSPLLRNVASTLVALSAMLFFSGCSVETSGEPPTYKSEEYNVDYESYRAALSELVDVGIYFTMWKSEIEVDAVALRTFNLSRADDKCVTGEIRQALIEKFITAGETVLRKYGRQFKLEFPNGDVREYRMTNMPTLTSQLQALKDLAAEMNKADDSISEVAKMALAPQEVTGAKCGATQLSEPSIVNSEIEQVSSETEQASSETEQEEVATEIQEEADAESIVIYDELDVLSDMQSYYGWVRQLWAIGYQFNHEDQSAGSWEFGFRFNSKETPIYSYPQEQFSDDIETYLATPEETERILTGFITAAERLVEKYQGVYLVLRTDGFPEGPFFDEVRTKSQSALALDLKQIAREIELSREALGQTKAQVQ